MKKLKKLDAKELKHLVGGMILIGDTGVGKMIGETGVGGGNLIGDTGVGGGN